MQRGASSQAWSLVRHGRAAADRSWFGYLLVLPALVTISVIILWPVVRAVGMSFTNYSLMQPSVEWVGLANFVDLFRDPVFRKSLGNSIMLTVSAVTLQYALGLGLAVLLNQEVRGIRLFRNLVMASWVIPVVATVVMFRFMAVPEYGFFNVLLTHLGLGRYATYWFGNLRWAMPAVVLMHLWRNIPLYAVALLAVMQGIPQELYEAASIDGAGAFRKFTAITFPSLRYISMVVVVLHVLWTFNNFDFVYLSTGGGPVDATMVLPVYVYERSWEYFTLGYAAAGGTVMLLVLAGFTVAYIWLLTRQG